MSYTSYIIKKYSTSHENATIRTQGIDPNMKNYSIPSIKDSNFLGYKILTYYYVSWAIGIPEMLY